MRQAGDVDAVSFAGSDHRRDMAVFAGLAVTIDAKPVWLDVALAHLGTGVDFDRVGEDDYLLSHVAHLGVGHDQHRGAILFGQIKSADSQVKEFLG